MKCNTRIEGSDSTQDIMFKMSEGNPGALTVCLEIMKYGERIDPDNAIGALGTLLSIDTANIYGPRIWMLYKDVCRENLSATIAIIRAYQLGLITRSVLDHAIDNSGDGIDVDIVSQQVKERLPAFVLE